MDNIMDIARYLWDPMKRRCVISIAVCAARHYFYNDAAYLLLRLSLQMIPSALVHGIDLNPASCLFWYQLMCEVGNKFPAFLQIIHDGSVHFVTQNGQSQHFALFLFLFFSI